MRNTKGIGISIIIPVFNAARYIDSCISSIVNQTYENWQLILINDGSTDSSLDICNSWADRDDRIIVISQDNKGAGFARNLGIECTKYSWLTFVDADDTIAPDYLSNFRVEELEEGEISIQGYQRIKADGTRLKEYKEFSSIYYDKAHIADSFSSSWILDYGQTVGKLYPKKFLIDNSIKFPVEYKISEDHKFFLLALVNAEGLRLHSGKLYNYIDWNNGNNLTSRKFNSNELWCRYESLKQSYIQLTDHFDIKDEKVINWLQYFVFTGSLSLYIQSIVGKTRNERLEKFQNLKNERKYIIKYFKPKSLRGFVTKLLIIYSPIKLLDNILP